MDETDIRQLLEARCHGEAFALIHERLKEKVFRLAFSIVRDETCAEDMTQDVFVRIWKGLPAYHGGASLSTWVYTITRNTCLTEVKRRGRHPTAVLPDGEEEPAAASQAAFHVAEGAPGAEMDAAQLLAQLPENYRQVITLFYMEQKAYEEVAEQLGIPLGTVKTLIFRAKKELVRIHARQEQRAALAVEGLPRPAF